MKLLLINKNLIKKILITSVFIFSPLALVQALTVSPPKIEISGNPGSQVKTNIILINERNQKQTYFSSYSLFEAQGESGSPNFLDAKEGLATWIKAPESVTLNPLEKKTIPITIDIPKDAKPGGNFAAIFWSGQPKGQAGQVSISAKIGILVLLSVKGDVVESGAILDFGTKDNKTLFDSLPVVLSYRFNNTGGDRIKPTGTITIKNIFGLKSAVIEGNPMNGNILPKSTRRFEILWAKDNTNIESKNLISGFFSNISYQWKNFAFGRYKAIISLSAGQEGTLGSAGTTFYVIPWQLLITIIIVLTTLFFFGRTIIRKYNKHIISRAQKIMSLRRHNSNE